MEILAICFGFVGLYATYLVLKFLRLACKALRIWINIQLYGKADDYSGYYERKRDDRN
jgi:fructose-specific phosphotransferase system component IIB